jgi:glycosyltransferase involved in cell wall biosynthesis
MQVVQKTIKIISILIPTYNEEENIEEIYRRIAAVFNERLPAYQYQILFIDNASEDNSQAIIRKLAAADKKVRAIYNVKNFGWARSSFYGLIHATGDATIFLQADMQEPPEMIPELIGEWEKGFKIVVCIKNKSRENPLVYFVRSMYYKFMKSMADIEHIGHFTGFGLYDRQFIQTLKTLDDPYPYLRGIVAELGYKHKKIYYEQAKRLKGKSKFNFLRLYDFAMLGITSYSKIPMRMATIIGFLFSVIFFCVAIFSFVQKLLFWDKYPLGFATIITSVFLIGSLQLFFIGLLGEYILNINTRIIKRPLVIESERINFED